MIKKNDLINILDNRSVDLSRLATLLAIQQDEMEDIDDSDNRDVAYNWKLKSYRITVLSNIVMAKLKRYSAQFDRIVSNYHEEKGD